jgi:GNAT superfamily N-acetyltransferase
MAVQAQYAERGWEMRPYAPGDEEALVALFAEVFGRAVSVDWWRWKLKGRPTPMENVLVAVSNDGEIVGQYAAIPARVKVGGRVREAMISVDTMTSPRWRRRGILSGLASAAYELYRKAGSDLIIGLPNEQWGSRTAALGWQRQFPLFWLRFPLRPDVLLRERVRLPGRARAMVSFVALPAGELWYGWAQRRLRSTGLTRIAVEPLTEAGSEIDALWSNIEPSLAAALVRDSSWVKWRYLDAVDASFTLLIAREGGMNARQKPCGYIAYRTVERDGRATGFIADLLAPPQTPGVSVALLAAALADLRKRQVALVLAVAPPGSDLWRTLRKGGFLPSKTAFSFEIVPLADDLQIDAVGDPSRWLLTAGDFDIV